MMFLWGNVTCIFVVFNPAESFIFTNTDSCTIYSTLFLSKCYVFFVMNDDVQFYIVMQFLPPLKWYGGL